MPKTVIQELTCDEYLEFMFLKWYYGHIQAYISNLIGSDDYDTFQEWIVDYYEHPDWGSNFRLKAPEAYKKNAKMYAFPEYTESLKRNILKVLKITEDDK
jgi:hypothetical protein